MTTSNRFLRLAVVIVNYRTPELTIDSVRSVLPQIDPTRDRIIVVDNGSKDRSPDLIEQAFDDEERRCLSLIRSAHNGGFAYGNNLGIKATSADFFLLLNSDALLRPGAITELLGAASAHPEFGILSPRLEWPDGRVQVSCFHFPRPASQMIEAAATGPVTKRLERYDIPLPVTDHPSRPEWTSFAAVLIRSHVFRQIGHLDAGYFLYFEDIDFCRRARAEGISILHWPGARVVHLRGKSSPLKERQQQAMRLPPFYYAARSRYFAKFYGRRGLLLANLYWLFGRCVSLLREMGGRSPHNAKRAALDLWHGYWNPTVPRHNGTLS